ncbi:hypothetical protein [Xanthomonas bundabergensis]|uniref:hypothetical protein n=1 Tax=Xanthomonas bundabergensis TaxID=3160842 RepID=UPI003514B4CF
MGIVSEWELKARLQPRSAELKRVDIAVLAWAKQGNGANGANVNAVRIQFDAWKSAQAAEYARLRPAADELNAEVVRQSAVPAAAPAGGAAPTQVLPVGWRLVAYDPALHGGALLPVAQRVAALTTAEIARVNEAVRRARAAVTLARDAVLEAARLKRFAAAPVPPPERACLDFFGAYDAARLQKLVENFRALVLAFDGTPDFIDVRNRVQWADTYGGCVRRNLVAKSAKGELSLSGKVEMLMGRAFLGGGNYEKSTDDTIATLAHEFAHGALNAVDVPDLDAAGAFQCARVSDDPAHADFGNSREPFAHQSSTEAMDKVLAQFHPAYALVNADNYGQFTKRVLIAARG